MKLKIIPSLLCLVVLLGGCVPDGSGQKESIESEISRSEEIQWETSSETGVALWDSPSSSKPNSSQESSAVSSEKPIQEEQDEEVSIQKMDLPGCVQDDHRYEFYDDAATWEEAREKCEKRGGYLAIINDKKENDYLFDLMKEKGYDSAYFGLHREANWYWVDGSVMTYTNWADGEPNTENVNEKYGMFYFKFDYEWNDGDFDVNTNSGGHVYICEWGENPEWAPLQASMRYHTDIGDYMVFDESLTWDEAKEKCEALGGHLLTIDSEEEQKLINGIVYAGTKSWFWIGLEKDAHDDTFYWIDGSELGFTNWSEDEPDNYDGDEDVTVISSDKTSREPGSWIDLARTGGDSQGYELNQIGYICEWD